MGRDQDPAMLSAERNIHVIRNLNRGWKVVVEPDRKVVGLYHKKENAIEAARRIASKNGAALYIHGVQGQIYHASDLPSRFSDEEVFAALRALEASRPSGKKLVYRLAGARSGWIKRFY
jgi:hypothetical protein